MPTRTGNEVPIYSYSAMLVPLPSPRERLAAALAAQQKPKKQVSPPAAARPHLGLTDAAEQAVAAVSQRFSQLFRVRPVVVVSQQRIAGGLSKLGEQAARAARARYRQATTPAPVPAGACRPRFYHPPVLVPRAATR